MTVLDFDVAKRASERIRAYYVLLSFAPELAHAPEVVRASEVDRVIAGLREADRVLGGEADALSSRGYQQLRGLMAMDAKATDARIKAGGW